MSMTPSEVHYSNTVVEDFMDDNGNIDWKGAYEDLSKRYDTAKTFELTTNKIHDINCPYPDCRRPFQIDLRPDDVVEKIRQGSFCIKTPEDQKPPSYGELEKNLLESLGRLVEVYDIVKDYGSLDVYMKTAKTITELNRWKESKERREKN